jgi:rSAM/selenodomain-associated transferase 2
VSGVRFSFVIPVLNEQACIADLLRSLEAGYPHSERIVVDGGSIDDTLAIARGLCHSLLTCESSRALQMNCGADVASGHYVFFLHADSRPTVSAQTLAKILTAAPGWGFCRSRLDSSNKVFRVIEAAMNIRSRVTSVATGDQMLFVRRDLLADTGGFANMPLMEDVEFCKRLRKHSSPTIIESPVISSSRRWETRGVARTVFQMWALRLAYVCGISPHRLWQQYYGR